MPWVRIEEKALTHPKIVGLSHGAFRLWVAGLAHCQQHLTDGFIPDAALKTFVAVSQPRIHELTRANLWQATTNGYQVHDYLDWNESRDTIRKKREAAKDRMDRVRGKRSPEQPGEQSANTPCGVDGREITPLPEGREEGLGETTLPARAGRFCEWYGETHERLIRVGYIGNPRKDYESALQLCEKFSDQELQDAATVWFGMTDSFAVNGTRTITKFASRATHCVQIVRREDIA